MLIYLKSLLFENIIILRIQDYREKNTNGW